MLIPLRNLNLDQVQSDVRIRDHREFISDRQARRPAYVSDRDPTKPRDLPYWQHPPIYEPPPLPRAELVASVDELLLRSLARSEPTEEELLLLMAA